MKIEVRGCTPTTPPNPDNSPTTVDGLGWTAGGSPYMYHVPAWIRPTPPPQGGGGVAGTHTHTIHPQPAGRSACSPNIGPLAIPEREFFLPDVPNVSQQQNNE